MLDLQCICVGKLCNQYYQNVSNYRITFWTYHSRKCSCFLQSRVHKRCHQEYHNCRQNRLSCTQMRCEGLLGSDQPGISCLLQEEQHYLILFLGGIDNNRKIRRDKVGYYWKSKEHIFSGWVDSRKRCIFVGVGCIDPCINRRFYWFARRNSSFFPRVCRITAPW